MLIKPVSGGGLGTGDRLQDEKAFRVAASEFLVLGNL
jgi:hypothetical protein